MFREQASAATCHFSKFFANSIVPTRCLTRLRLEVSFLSLLISLGRLKTAQRQPRGSLSCRKSGGGIARFLANALKRQPSAELACVWKFRASGAISWILSQQTTYSASLPDPSPANDSANLQHVPANDFDSLKLQRTTSKILGRPQGKPWPANESANPEDHFSCEKGSLTSPKCLHIVPTKRPTRLRLEVLFVTLLISFGKLKTAPTQRKKR